MMTTFFFFRHSDANLGGELRPDGVAKASRAKFTHKTGEVTVAFCSPVHRAERTAQLLVGSTAKVIPLGELAPTLREESSEEDQAAYGKRAKEKILSELTKSGDPPSQVLVCGHGANMINAVALAFVAADDTDAQRKIKNAHVGPCEGFMLVFSDLKGELLDAQLLV